MKTYNSNDKEISNLFEYAKYKTDKIDEQAKEKKKQIVIKLAKNLEGKIPQTDTICIEIVHQLRDEVSERFIRECLDEKYKQKIRVGNAKKQKQQKDDKLAEIIPLNQKQYPNKNKEIFAVDIEGKNFAQKEEDKSNENPEENIVKKDNDFDKLHFGLQQLDQQKQQQQQKENIQERELKKEFKYNNELDRSSCQELYNDNHELKETPDKLTPFYTARDILKYISKYEERKSKSKDET